jgi:hypothetical protein
MLNLILIALLLALPFGRDDKPRRTGSEPNPPRSLVLRSAAPSARSAPAPSWNVGPTTVSRTTAWANLGYGIINKEYDDAGKSVALGQDRRLPSQLSALAASLGTTLPLPAGVDGTVTGAYARIEGETNVLNAHVGASYDVVSRPGFGFAVGADLGFSQQNFQAEQVHFDLANAKVTIPAMGLNDVPLSVVATQMGLQIPESVPLDRKLESGFKAQNLLVFTEVRNNNIAARVGFLTDVGPDPDTAQNERETTDRQHAFLLGASGRYPSGSMVLFGGLEGFFTLASREAGMLYDAGDIYGLHAGAGYRFSIGEVGLAVTYRYRSEGEHVSVASNLVSLDASDAGYHVGLAPYVNISPKGARYTMFFKGGVQDEYRDYTLSVVGKNDHAPHMGGTVGIVYNL